MPPLIHVYQWWSVEMIYLPVPFYFFFAAPRTGCALYMYFVLLLGSDVSMANLAGLNLWRHVQGFSIC